MAFEVLSCDSVEYLRISGSSSNVCQKYVNRFVSNIYF